MSGLWTDCEYNIKSIMYTKDYVLAVGQSINCYNILKNWFRFVYIFCKMFQTTIFYNEENGPELAVITLYSLWF